MINEILQWVAILAILFVLFYPSVKQFVHDFREEEEEE